MMLNRTLRTTLAIVTLAIALTSTIGASLTLHINLTAHNQSHQYVLDELTATPTPTPDGFSIDCIGCSGGSGGPK